METAVKIVLGGTLLSGAYFMLKGKEGEAVRVGTLAFKVAGDQCYADVTIKNTGGLVFAPIVSFLIEQAPFGALAAPPVTGLAFAPGATQAVTTGKITIPATAIKGAVRAIIRISDPSFTLIPGAEVDIAEAYTITGYGAQIISYTFQ